jgi:hypothetical protein
MSRKVRRVPVRLDAGGIKGLALAEIQAILRGADDLIMRGGRSLLVKVLRGSRAKEVLANSLESSPVHGYYKHLPVAEVEARVDWMILNDYLDIEYDYRLPLLVYTSRGWEIERETYAEELFQKLQATLMAGAPPFDVGQLKDRNREIIWRLLEKIEASGDQSFLPLLEAWAAIDYKKVRQRIREVIGRLGGAG